MRIALRILIRGLLAILAILFFCWLSGLFSFPFTFAVLTDPATLIGTNGRSFAIENPFNSGGKAYLYVLYYDKIPYAFFADSLGTSFSAARSEMRNISAGRVFLLLALLALILFFPIMPFTPSPKRKSRWVSSKKTTIIASIFSSLLVLALLPALVLSSYAIHGLSGGSLPAQEDSPTYEGASLFHADPRPLTLGSELHYLNDLSQTWPAAVKKSKDITLYGDFHLANTSLSLPSTLRSLTIYAPSAYPQKLSLSLAERTAGFALTLHDFHQPSSSGPLLEGASGVDVDLKLIDSEIAMKSSSLYLNLPASSVDLELENTSLNLVASDGADGQNGADGRDRTTESGAENGRAGGDGQNSALLFYLAQMDIKTDAGSKFALQGGQGGHGGRGGSAGSLCNDWLCLVTSPGRRGSDGEDGQSLYPIALTNASQTFSADGKDYPLGKAMDNGRTSIKVA